MTIGQLRQMLTDSFSQEELKNLCFDLGVDFESLPGEGKSGKARELTGYMQRTDRLEELLALCQRARPNIAWSDLVTAEGKELPASGSPVLSTSRENPFTYGNPITEPDRFFGRRREVEHVFSRLRNAEHESSSVVGGRRIGKTSLLKYLAHPKVRRRFDLDPQRHIFVYVDMQLVDKGTTPDRLWQHLLQQMSRHCHDAELKVATKEVVEAGSFDTFSLADLFDIVDERHQHVVFLLDEFENVTENANFGPDFFYALRSLAIQHNFSLVTSSDRELIELCHSEAIRSSPFFNIFANINLRLFEASEARELITSSLSGTAVSFAESEIVNILEMAGRHPFFLQVACHFLFESHMDQLDVNARPAYVLAEFRQQAAPHLEHYWHKSNEHEKVVLVMLALMGRQEQTGRPAFTPQQMEGLYTRAGHTLSRLEQWGYVASEDGRYALFSTLFGDWILTEIADTSEDKQPYQEWLGDHQEAVGQLPGGEESELAKVLPQLNAQYRALLLSWASEPGNYRFVSTLLQQVANA